MLTKTETSRSNHDGALALSKTFSLDRNQLSDEQKMRRMLFEVFGAQILRSINELTIKDETGKNLDEFTAKRYKALLTVQACNLLEARNQATSKIHSWVKKSLEQKISMAFLSLLADWFKNGSNNIGKNLTACFKKIGKGLETCNPLFEKFLLGDDHIPFDAKTFEIFDFSECSKESIKNSFMKKILEFYNKNTSNAIKGAFKKMMRGSTKLSVNSTKKFLSEQAKITKESIIKECLALNFTKAEAEEFYQLREDFLACYKDYCEQNKDTTKRLAQINPHFTIDTMDGHYEAAYSTYQKDPKLYLKRVCLELEYYKIRFPEQASSADYLLKKQILPIWDEFFPDDEELANLEHNLFENLQQNIPPSFIEYYKRALLIINNYDPDCQHESATQTKLLGSTAKAQTQKKLTKQHNHSKQLILHTPTRQDLDVLAKEHPVFNIPNYEAGEINTQQVQSYVNVRKRAAELPETNLFADILKKSDSKKTARKDIEEKFKKSLQQAESPTEIKALTETARPYLNDFENPKNPKDIPDVNTSKLESWKSIEANTKFIQRTGSDKPVVSKANKWKSFLRTLIPLLCLLRIKKCFNENNNDGQKEKLLTIFWYAANFTTALHIGKAINSHYTLSQYFTNFTQIAPAADLSLFAACFLSSWLILALATAAEKAFRQHRTSNIAESAFTNRNFTFSPQTEKILKENRTFDEVDNLRGAIHRLYKIKRQKHKLSKSDKTQVKKGLYKLTNDSKAASNAETLLQNFSPLFAETQNKPSQKTNAQKTKPLLNEGNIDSAESNGPVQSIADITQKAWTRIHLKAGA